jgi:hypothetical protein
VAQLGSWLEIAKKLPPNSQAETGPMGVSYGPPDMFFRRNRVSTSFASFLGHSWRSYRAVVRMLFPETQLQDVAEARRDMDHRSSYFVLLQRTFQCLALAQAGVAR